MSLYPEHVEELGFTPCSLRMDPIYYIDRKTQEKQEEKVYGLLFIYLVYGQYPLSGLLGRLLRPLARMPWISRLYGKAQSSKFTQRKVAPFVERYHVNMNEAEKKVGQFTSFNDFFTRKLKKGAREIPPSPSHAIIPADGRYLFIPNIAKQDGFYVKGKKFSLKSFLGDAQLAERYKNGVMVIARLCPTDYHRFHFPCPCVPEKPRLVNGYLSSVNPTSLKHNIEVFTENKRMVTLLNTESFGQMVYVEVGATCVGTIEQTFAPQEKQAKGAEKGYFAFGGSSLVLLFEPERIQLDEDLIRHPPHLEIKCQFGESLGSAL